MDKKLTLDDVKILAERIDENGLEYTISEYLLDFKKLNDPLLNKYLYEYIKSKNQIKNILKGCFKFYKIESLEMKVKTIDLL